MKPGKGTEIATIAGEELWLLPEKAIFWPRKSMLLISDLHLGKALHFRKAGIPLPRNAESKDFIKMAKLFAEFEAEKVVFLGDLFHSSHNQDWDNFGVFLQHNSSSQHILVQGNHDILKKHHYRRYGISLYTQSYLERPFYFTHHPQETVPTDWYNLAGHVHPAVRLQGNGRQGLKLPCFWFGENAGLLPAFASSAGHARMKPHSGELVFVIAETEVIRIQ